MDQGESTPAPLGIGDHRGRVRRMRRTQRAGAGAPRPRTRCSTPRDFRSAARGKPAAGRNPGSERLPEPSGPGPPHHVPRPRRSRQVAALSSRGSHPAGLPWRERAHLERAARRRAGTERTRPPAHPPLAPPLRGLARPSGPPPAWAFAWRQPDAVRLTAAQHSPSPGWSGSNPCGRSPARRLRPGRQTTFPTRLQGRGAARQSECAGASPREGGAIPTVEPWGLPAWLRLVCRVLSWEAGRGPGDDLTPATPEKPLLVRACRCLTHAEGRRGRAP